MDFAQDALQRLSREIWVLESMDLTAGDAAEMIGQLAERSEQLAHVLHKFEKAEEEANSDAE